MRPILVLNSHPIQYFAPFYQKLEKNGSVSITVWYCSNRGVTDIIDPGFGKSIKWDIPLLEGYRYEFLKNYSPFGKSYTGFWSLMNLGVVGRLWRLPSSVIVVHGWSYFTHLLVIFLGKIFGHHVCLRAETPLHQELQKNLINRGLKRLFLPLFFGWLDKLLFIGNQNKWFYQYHKVNNEKLIPALYCVDNDRFREVYNRLNREQACDKIGIDFNKKVILFSGKYIRKKRPMDLIRAIQLLNNKDLLAIFVGEGELRSEMEEYISKNKLTEQVILTGFINQSDIPYYYRACHVFVMCSEAGETWGLSVNEAMNFGVPAIVSDSCGCAYDLIDDNLTGKIFPTGDIKSLAKSIDWFLNMDNLQSDKISTNVLNKIDHYDYDHLINSFTQLSEL